MLEIGLKYIEYDENSVPAHVREQEHDLAYELLYSMLKEHFGLENPEILKSENGKPYVELFGKTKDLLGDRKIDISISHEKEYATAICIVL